MPFMKRGQVLVGLAFSAATAGCEDPIVGEWTLRLQNGHPPTYTFSGCTIDHQARLTVKSGLDAELLESITYADNCGGYYEDELYILTGEVEPFDDRRSANEHAHYAIRLAAGEDSLQLSCTLDAEGDTLSCDSVFRGNWIFE